MNCQSCSGKVEPEDRFCAACGKTLEGISGKTTAAATPLVPELIDGAAHDYVPGKRSRYWAIGAHLSAVAGGFLGGIPAFFGPLIVWLVRRDTDPFAATHGRAALNFNLSVLLYGFGLVVMSIVTFGIGLVIAIPAGILLAIAWLAFSLAGAIKAANDEPFRYPFSIPFVK